MDAALKAGAEIRKVCFHRFSPQGVSGVVTISESHITIHTWPEENYAAIDVFTCGNKADPAYACFYIAKKLKSEKVCVRQFVRGIKNELNEEWPLISTKMITLKEEAVVYDN